MIQIAFGVALVVSGVLAVQRSSRRQRDSVGAGRLGSYMTWGQALGLGLLLIALGAGLLVTWRP